MAAHPTVDIMLRLLDSLIDNPHRWALAALLVALCLIACMDVRPAIQNWGAVPGELGALRAAVETVPGQLAGQILPVAQTEVRHAADALIGEVRGAREDLAGQLSSARLDMLGPDGRFVALQSAVLQRADEGLRIIDATRREGVQPVLVAAAGAIGKIGATADTYAALPAQVAQSPAWLALQPEITCRQLDGSGYGGCWHSRVTALMGEAARVGGVFTQRFPSLAESATGIAGDIHGWTNKYVMPHKLTTWGKIKIGLGVTRDIGVAGLRSGAF